MQQKIWHYGIIVSILMAVIALGATIPQNKTDFEKIVEYRGVTAADKNKYSHRSRVQNQRLTKQGSRVSIPLEISNYDDVNESHMLTRGHKQSEKNKLDMPFKSEADDNMELAMSSESSMPGRNESDSNREDSHQAVKIVKYETGDTIRLKCHIPNGPYLVMWNKIGVDYPLSIGTRRFVPDERVQIRFKAPDKWRLTINNAKLSDSGVYTCTTSARKEDAPSTSADGELQETGRLNNDFDETDDLKHENVHNRLTGTAAKSKRRKVSINNDYYVTVVEPNPSDRFQVDAPALERVVKLNKSIVVTGPKIVFYGTPLELICRASFPSSEAKLNPTISLEWYHRGVRRRASPTRSGGVYISERWLDSNLLESRLLVAWASEADAGQWICLDRSQFPSVPGVIRTDKGYHYFSYPNMKQEGTNSVHLSASTSYQQANGLVATQSQVPAMLAASVANMKDRDLMFDRIEVEIVDLPDPTAAPSMDPFGHTIPTFVKPGALKDYHAAPHLYGKRETAAVLQSPSGSHGKAYAQFHSVSQRNSIPSSLSSTLIIVFIFEYTFLIVQ